MAKVCLGLLVSHTRLVRILCVQMEAELMSRELIFHPFRRWVTKGPITPLFRQFVYSDIPLHSKFTISGYIFSYYAIACAWGLTIMNYFVQGWGCKCRLSASAPAHQILTYSPNRRLLPQVVARHPRVYRAVYRSVEYSVHYASIPS